MSHGKRQKKTADELALEKSRRFARHFHGELERVEMKAKQIKRDLSHVPVASITVDMAIVSLKEIIEICQATVDYN